ncbi:MAG TPA: hypothetical protein VGE18_02795 [Candidatus Paceibacterota bacterium]
MSSHDTQKGPNSQDVFAVWKHPGETLAVLLERFRSEQGLTDAIKLTYAGRLDPMAEGVVIILKGDARFYKDDLLGLDKTYELTVLLGVSTDTADMLGLVTAINTDTAIVKESIENAVKSLEGVTELAYPLYSSRTVDGMPLFVHARAGTVVRVPTKKVQVTGVQLQGIEYRTLAEGIEETLPVIQNVAGDFRQEEIIKKWMEVIAKEGEKEIPFITIRITATSGTYMRALAEVVGATAGIPALAYRIKRVRIGEYTI